MTTGPVLVATGGSLSLLVFSFRDTCVVAQSNPPTQHFTDPRVYMTFHHQLVTMAEIPTSI